MLYIKSIFAYCIVPFTLVNLFAQDLTTEHDNIATIIVKSLDPQPGEKVVIRYDPVMFTGLEQTIAGKLKATGNEVKVFQYGPVDDFKNLMDDTDIYIWLPVNNRPSSYPPDQVAILGNWLDDGSGRQIHFHWGDGTRYANSANAEHNKTYDDIYISSIKIDHQELNRQQNIIIGLLRSGSIHVTTEAGTDITFSIGNRPVTKQNGNASNDAMKNARNRIDREIELPAGAIRMAPLEETVNGTMVIPSLLTAGGEVKDLKLEIKNGKIVKYEAKSGVEDFTSLLKSQDAINHFREFGLGVNPALQIPDNYEFIPYYGYGAGVVRLSLGNNLEIGGNVGGSGVQWLFFPKATVTVGDKVIVKNGALMLE